MLRPVGQIPGGGENTHQLSVSPGSCRKQRKGRALCPVAVNKPSTAVSYPWVRGSLARSWPGLPCLLPSRPALPWVQLPLCHPSPALLPALVGYQSPELFLARLQPPGGAGEGAPKWPAVVGTRKALEACDHLGRALSWPKTAPLSLKTQTNGSLHAGLCF